MTTLVPISERHRRLINTLYVRFVFDISVVTFVIQIFVIVTAFCQHQNFVALFWFKQQHGDLPSQLW